MLFECVGDEEQLVLQPERAGVGDTLDQEVPRIVERRQSLGKGAGRGSIARARRLTAEKVVRPLVVVERAKAIEGALLRGEVVTRRAAGSGFQRPVHAFVGSVLLGRGGVNTLMLGPEGDPPAAGLRGAMETTRREGGAGV